MIRELREADVTTDVQETTFSIDVLGRYICSTWDEAVSNGGLAPDVVVIGAGMFGAYFAEKMYRDSNLRVLVLDAGRFLVSQHVQNLPRIGLNVPGARAVALNAQDPPLGDRVHERVWGWPWRSDVAFPGLAYCIGGRSLYWGGWSPRLTDADLAAWPADVAAYLRASYEATERETGVFDKTDYITGPLFEALRARFQAAAPRVATVDAIEDAPLAVQAAAPASGLFSFDKYSSVPILAEAIREDTAVEDWRRRLFLVPRVNVVRLETANGAVSGITAYVNGVQKTLPIDPACAVVLAAGTIESTRLALESFPTPAMGHNLMAHLRSNTTVRIHRSAFDPGLPQRLEAAALLVRGSTGAGRYHLQVTAACVMGSNPETYMFGMVPDIDLLDRMLAAQGGDWIVVTLRGIGEMKGQTDASVAKVNGQAPSWIDLSDQADPFAARRAWVNLATSGAEAALWDAMDGAALELAQRIAGTPDKIEYFYNRDGSLNAPGAAWHAEPPPKSASNDRNDPANKVRDGLGTTHHEAGTLWMGSDPSSSVTDLHGRFHHIANAYAVGPAVFPTLGSANPSLTALTLARRTVEAVLDAKAPLADGFRRLGNGGLRGWKMAGSGSFIELGGGILESVDGIGLLWFTEEQFSDFVLRLEWRASARGDNSGVFLRVPPLGDANPATDWQPAVNEGYEVQIDDTGKNPDTNPPTFGDMLHITGSIYTLAKASTLASKPVGQWNLYEIRAQGREIAVTLNGQLVSRLTNADRRLQGYIGLQNHHPGSRVQFRNLEIMPIAQPQAPPAAGTRAGRAPIPAL